MNKNEQNVIHQTYSEKLTIFLSITNFEIQIFGTHNVADRDVKYTGWKET